MPIELNPPLTGDEIKRRLSEKIVHEPIAEGFLYKHSSLMISSQPSIGKSVLAIQAAIELSNGLPLFGVLNVPNPIIVWYIQAERADIESLERIQLMTEDMPNISYNNLYIDTELQSLSFLNPDHQTLILARGREIKPDLIIIDPLYGIAGGLSKDEVCSAIAKILTVLKSKLGCAIWINHHTVKTTYDVIDGVKMEKGDPFYGAQWLKAHVTASYLATMGEKGVHLSCKKDSHSVLLKSIDLEFDHETYLSRMTMLDSTYLDKLYLHIISLKTSGKKTFFFDEIRDYLGCTISQIRKIMIHPKIQPLVKKHKSNGKKTLYEVLEA